MFSKGARGEENAGKQIPPVFGRQLNKLAERRFGSSSDKVVQCLVSELEKLGHKVRDNTVRAWLKGEAFPEVKNLESLCTVLDCEPYELLGGEKPVAHFSCKPEELDQAHTSLAPEDEVLLFTGMHLIESGLAVQRAKHLLQKTKARVSFVYPLPGLDRDEPRKDEKATPERVTEDLRDWARQNDHDRLRTLIFDPVVGGVGCTSGMIEAVLRGGGLHAIYQEVRCQSIDGSRDGDEERWLRITSKDAEWLWGRLRKSLVPVANPRWERDRLAGLIQTNNRRQGDGPPRAVHDLRNTRHVDRHFYQHVKDFTDRFRGDDRALDVLEVGPADFWTSYHLLYRFLNQSQDYFTTGVESAKLLFVPKEAALPELAKRLPQELEPGTANVRHLCNTLLFEKPLETWRPGARRFNLVVCFYSLHLIDPDQISKLLAVLRPGGYLLILHQSGHNNVLTRICAAVDRFLEERLHVEKPKLNGNPLEHHRLYSEDLEAWFAANGLVPDKKPIVTSVRVDRLVDAGNKEFSLECRGVVEYFLKDVSSFDAWRGSKAAEELLHHLLDKAQSVTCENEDVALIVQRKEPDDNWVCRPPSPF